jgi:hypothetical protein
LSTALPGGGRGAGGRRSRVGHRANLRARRSRGRAPNRNYVFSVRNQGLRITTARGWATRSRCRYRFGRARAGARHGCGLPPDSAL